MTEEVHDGQVLGQLHRLVQGEEAAATLIGSVVVRAATAAAMGTGEGGSPSSTP